MLGAERVAPIDFSVTYCTSDAAAKERGGIDWSQWRQRNLLRTVAPLAQPAPRHTAHGSAAKPLQLAWIQALSPVRCERFTDDEHELIKDLFEWCGMLSTKTYT